MSTILQNWQAGRGLPGVLVIDGHTHIGRWHIPLTFLDGQTPETAAESARIQMDANGVDACCALPTGYYQTGGDYRLGNDFLMQAAALLPDRVIPFPSLNPNDTRTNIMAELERMTAAGARCLKLVNALQQHYPGDGPNLMAVYEYATAHNMPILNHYWSVNELRTIASRFPDLVLICGHYRSEQDTILSEFPNVYANIWGYSSYGWLDRGFREVGAHRFLFGSDAFLNPVSVGIGPVVHADIPDEAKKQVLGLTMARILDRAGALPAAIKKKYPGIAFTEDTEP